METYVFENPRLKSIGDIAEALQRAGEFNQIRFTSGYLSKAGQPNPDFVKSYVFGIKPDTGGFYVADREFRRLNTKLFAIGTDPLLVEVGGSVVTPEMIGKIQQELGLNQVQQ